jgi:hypothetical protein
MSCAAFGVPKICLRLVPRKMGIGNLFVFCVCLSVCVHLLYTPHRDWHDQARRPQYKHFDVSTLDRCSWAEQPYAWSGGRLDAQNREVARYLEKLIGLGVPIILRNGNALAARRRDSKLDAKVHFDIDVHLIVPQGGFSSTLNYVNAHVDKPFHSLHSYNWLAFGEVAMWTDGRTDVNVLSESLIFENEDFQRQCEIAFDLDVVGAFSSLCRTDYFGFDLLAHEDPYQTNMLKHHYGKRCFNSSKSNQYAWNLIYPRWFMRTYIGKWLVCYFSPHATVWFFDVSWWTQRPIRDREGAFLRKGIYPREKGIPGCW